jgi:hypothetical protein
VSFGPPATQPGGLGRVSFRLQLPMVLSAKPQVQVQRTRAKPSTNDLEAPRAAAILVQRGRLRWGQG